MIQVKVGIQSPGPVGFLNSRLHIFHEVHALGSGLEISSFYPFSKILSILKMLQSGPYQGFSLVFFAARLYCC